MRTYRNVRDLTPLLASLTYGAWELANKCFLSGAENPEATSIWMLRGIQQNWAPTARAVTSSTMHACTSFLSFLLSYWPFPHSCSLEVLPKINYWHMPFLSVLSEKLRLGLGVHGPGWEETLARPDLACSVSSGLSVFFSLCQINFCILSTRDKYLNPIQRIGDVFTMYPMGRDTHMHKPVAWMWPRLMCFGFNSEVEAKSPKKCPPKQIADKVGNMKKQRVHPFPAVTLQ